jgi:hypothetical protein
MTEQQPVYVDEQGNPIQMPTYVDENGNPRTVESLGTAKGIRAPRGAEWLDVFKDDPLIKGAQQGMGLPIGGQATVMSEPFKRVGNWLTSRAEPAIRSALKPTVSAMKQAAGASRTGIDAQAKRLAGIVRRTRVTTPEQAEAAIKQQEQLVQSALERHADTPTDAPQRALRYLDRVNRSAATQMAPADDLAAVATERQKFLESTPLFASHERLARTPQGQVVPKATNRPDRTATELKTVVDRVPREDVNVPEALTLARGTSRNQTRKQFGEQKSMSMESQKALDRAGRDAAKEAAPELRPALQTQGELIRLKDVLDRRQFRENNRDQLSLPGVVGAAPALAAGKIPFLGIVAQWLRDNQLKAGLMADKYGPKITRNAQLSGEELQLALQALMRTGQSPTEPRE